MNEQEVQQIQEMLLGTCCGILYYSKEFAQGDDVSFEYHFDCPEFSELKEKYPIEEIAGEGGDFQRALRLCRWLAPRLKHQSDYDNHVPCNSLALMEYCFEKKDVGINCLNKAKIFVECCLSVGIYARRVWMFPASPYDLDNHVVAEIFDRELKKWIFLDPTSGGYFTDGESPLSSLEVRAMLAEGRKISIVFDQQNPKEFSELREKPENLQYNAYYAKNFYYLTTELITKFGDDGSGKCAYLLPKGLDLKEHTLENLRYTIAALKDMGYEGDIVKFYESELDNASKDFTVLVGTVKMWDAPTA